MNICCLTKITLSHEAKGGLEVHVKTLSEGLVRLGHRVTIITTAHPVGIEYEAKEGVEIYYCRGTIPGQLSKAWGEASLMLLSELHRRSPFDIVWGEDDGAYYYIRTLRDKLNIPAVTFLQASFLGTLRTQISEIRFNKNLIALFARQFPKQFYRYLTYDLVYAGRADAVIGPSKEIARDAKAEYFLRKDRIFETVNGVDVEHFRPLECNSKTIHKKDFEIEEGTPLIFTAARLVRVKGIHVLIRAFSRILQSIPDVMLLIAGIGQSEEQLKTLTMNLKIDKRVLFLGYIPNDELIYYYNICEVFVYPTFLYEAFGISVAEAMACGRPVVAGRSGGISTSIDHGINGFLYRPDSVEQLSDICIRLLKDPKLREEIGQSARRKAVESLSSNRMIRDTLKVFESAIHKNKDLI